MKGSMNRFGALALILAGAALLAASPMDRLTAEQKKQLEAGEAIFESVKQEGKDGKTTGHAQALALINAPVETCFKTFLDFEKHQLYFPRKTESKIVKGGGTDKVWVHKVFDFYVTDIEYTVVYSIDAKNHRVDYKLDPSYPHDIEASEGFFLFEKVDEKRTLFTYAVTKVDTGVKVPGTVQNYLTSRDLPAVAANVKKRIESGGKWTKED